MKVMWHIDNKELGRPFIGANTREPVRIYGCVLPTGAQARYMSCFDMKWGVRVPIFLLVEAKINPELWHV